MAAKKKRKAARKAVPKKPTKGEPNMQPEFSLSTPDGFTLMSVMLACRTCGQPVDVPWPVEHDEPQPELTASDAAGPVQAHRDDQCNADGEPPESEPEKPEAGAPV